MKRKLFVLMMSLLLVFSFSQASFAAVADGGEVAAPYATHSITYALDRTSASTADVYVNVIFTSVVDSYNVVVYLQKYEDGEWVIDIDNDEYVKFNTGIGRRIVTFFNTYEGLERGVSYRIMCISRDFVGDVDTRLTSYSNAF